MSFVRVGEELLMRDTATGHTLRSVRHGRENDVSFLLEMDGRTIPFEAQPLAQGGWEVMMMGRAPENGGGFYEYAFAAAAELASAKQVIVTALQDFRTFYGMGEPRDTVEFRVLQPPVTPRYAAISAWAWRWFLPLFALALLLLSWLYRSVFGVTV